MSQREMKQPRTPSSQRLAPATDGSGRDKAPRTPSANRLAPSGQPSSAAATARATLPGRVWRGAGGDRKIMFENRGGHANALVPEWTRPRTHVAALHLCSWLLLAVGVFQVVVSKLSDFRWPLHWVGVLLMLLALVTMVVRIYTGRCGTSPQCVTILAALTIAACLTSWLACEGPLYADVKEAADCQDVVNRGDCTGSDCVCFPDDPARLMCVDFEGHCGDIPSNRRYLVFSMVSLWIALGLAAITGIIALMIITGCGDSRATAAASAASAQKWGRTGLDMGTNASSRKFDTSNA